MRSIHLSVFVVLYLSASLNGLVHCSEQFFVQSIHHGTFIRKNFLKGRISYYSNCSASFQIELLHAGDVHPNPGPDRGKDDSLSSSPRPDHHLHHLQLAIRYSPSELLQWRHPRIQLPHNVQRAIRSLGIHRRRTRRGTRGGKRKNSTSITQKSQDRPSSNFRLCSDTSDTSVDANHDELNFCVLNARSLRNKSTDFQDFVADKHLDIVCVCETWLTTCDDAVIADLCPDGFTFKHRPRVGRRGGGIGLLYCNQLDVVIKPHVVYESFEMMSATVTSKGISTDIVTIYRPPGTQSALTQFLDEFTSMLDDRLLRATPLLICGDLNIHLDNLTSSNTKRFIELLSSHGLLQVVDEATHEKGHILDVLIFRKFESHFHSNLQVTPGISDHSAITCKLHVGKPHQISSCKVVRNIKVIDRNAFAADVLHAFTSVSTIDIQIAVDNYNSQLRSILEIVAPAKTRCRRDHSFSPWYNHEIAIAKRSCRQAELKWRSQGKLEIDRQLYCNQRKAVNSLVRKAKCNYYVILIEDCGTDSKRLFSVANHLLGRKKSSPLPAHVDSESLAQLFMQFFQSKTNKICSSMSTDFTQSSSVQTSASLLSFEPTTPAEIERLLRNMPPKSCEVSLHPPSLKEAIS
ncbi:uncharacterized protein LOC121406191 [Lytechinus variegatus]|uniref:uncharacterized protein LOC121406191 n=1 Tax=Lytechinus variegatus TaxID=7654 RepID=UPI001BB2CE66|nr:uncharacterized protein LOC121406191 [Lytechinus variegatus]